MTWTRTGRASVTVERGGETMTLSFRRPSVSDIDGWRAIMLRPMTTAELTAEVDGWLSNLYLGASGVLEEDGSPVTLSWDGVCSELTATERADVAHVLGKVNVIDPKALGTSNVTLGS